MGSTHPAVAIAVLLFLFTGATLMVFDKRSGGKHKWAMPATLIALSSSLLALILAVCLAISDPWGDTCGHGLDHREATTRAESR